MSRSLSSATLRPGSDSRDSSTERTPPVRKSRWFGSYTVESLGLSEFVENSTSIIPNPLNLLPSFVKSYLPSFTSEVVPSLPEEEDEDLQKDAERIFLSYSWWFLNVGWRGIADRVENQVERVSSGVGLKRELSVGEWEGLIKEVRAGVEAEVEEDQLELYECVRRLNLC